MSLTYTNDFVRKVVENDTNHEYSLLLIEEKGAKNTETGKWEKRKMEIRHNPCGHTYKINIYEFLEGKRRCGKCKGKRLRLHHVQTVEEIKKKTIELTDGEYAFVDDHFVNSKHKHNFKHNSCGTVFEKKWEKFKEGQRCTKCYQKGMESVASRYVRDILDHLDIGYETEKRFDDCINPETRKVLPFDYYLPEINTLIEVDGEQHERGSFNKYDSEGTMKRDRIKDRYAEEKGIELVRIPAKKWSQLPEILHDIIAGKLLPDLTLEDVKSIAQSSHPERINKDLAKIHNSEYRLKDPYYFGVDRVHSFEHTVCGHKFQSTLFMVKSSKFPCPKCRKKILSKKNHDKTNAKLLKKSKGRYSLNPTHIGTDKKLRRLTQCHRCNTSWWVIPGNIMKDKAGCPNCLAIKKEKEWVQKLNEIENVLKNRKKLSKAQSHWLGHNRRQYQKNLLKEHRLELLKKAGLL